MDFRAHLTQYRVHGRVKEIVMQEPPKSPEVRKFLTEVNAPVPEFEAVTEREPGTNRVLGSFDRREIPETPIVGPADSGEFAAMKLEKKRKILRDFAQSQI